MDPSKIGSAPSLPKPLNEGTLPEPNEKEKVVDQIGAEFLSVMEIGTMEVGTVEVEVKTTEEPEAEQQSRISSDHVKRSSRVPLMEYETEKERLKGLKSKKKSASGKKNILKPRHENSSSTSKEDEKSTKACKDRELEEEGGEDEFSTEGDNTEDDESFFRDSNATRYTTSEESDSDSRHLERETSPPYISKTVPVTEYFDRVLVTLKQVNKKTIIRILDNETNISCEFNYNRKQKCDLSDDLKWGPKKTYRRNFKEIIITPKVPNTNVLNRSGIQPPNVSEVSTSGKDSDRADRSARKNEGGLKSGIGIKNKRISSANNEGTSAGTKGLLVTDPTPSTSTKRVMDTVPGTGSKKIRLNRQDSVTEPKK